MLKRRIEKLERAMGKADDNLVVVILPYGADEDEQEACIAEELNRRGLTREKVGLLCRVIRFVSPEDKRGNANSVGNDFEGQ